MKNRYVFFGAVQRSPKPMGSSKIKTVHVQNGKFISTSSLCRVCKPPPRSRRGPAKKNRKKVAGKNGWRGNGGCGGLGLCILSLFIATMYFRPDAEGGEGNACPKREYKCRDLHINSSLSFFSACYCWRTQPFSFFLSFFLPLTSHPHHHEAGISSVSGADGRGCAGYF